MTVTEIFASMQAHFNPTAAAGLNKVIQISLSGEESGVWAIKIANQTCELIPGGVEKPDLSLTMADKDWIALIEGHLAPMSAFMTGKVKATGELPLAMRMLNIFNLQR
jgi:putative sterol carrier protein